MIGGNKGLQTVLYSLHAMLYVTVHGQCCIFIFHNFYCDTNTYVFFMNMNKSKLCMYVKYEYTHIYHCFRSVFSIYGFYGLDQYQSYTDQKH